MLAFLVVLLLASRAADTFYEPSSLEYWYESNDGAHMDYGDHRELDNMDKVARVDKSSESLVLRLATKIQDLARDIEDYAQQLKNAESLNMKVVG